MATKWLAAYVWGMAAMTKDESIQIVIGKSTVEIAEVTTTRKIVLTKEQAQTLAAAIVAKWGKAS